jgi:hypothetical protein
MAALEEPSAALVKPLFNVTRTITVEQLERYLTAGGDPNFIKEKDTYKVFMDIVTENKKRTILIQLTLLACNPMENPDTIRQLTSCIELLFKKDTPWSSILLIDHADIDQHNALYFAFHHRNLSICNLLLTNEASFSLYQKDKEGQLPYYGKKIEIRKNPLLQQDSSAMSFMDKVDKNDSVKGLISQLNYRFITIDPSVQYKRDRRYHLYDDFLYRQNLRRTHPSLDRRPPLVPKAVPVVPEAVPVVPNAAPRYTTYVDDDTGVRIVPNVPGGKSKKLRKQTKHKSRNKRNKFTHMNRYLKTTRRKKYN